ncbi:hypothetical protein C8R46DRAFT_1093054 [Mycena filopes]|nr:hypothetical protein C8R46DRAFT_1093054 [Mycena filopes]
MEHESTPEIPSHLAGLMASNSPPSESEASEIRDAIAVHTEALRGLTSEVEPLVAQRDELVVALTSLSILLSATRTLPFDILTRLFRETVDLTGDPWVLTYVSSGWRAVAINSPDLWTSIDIDNAANDPKRRPTGYSLEKLDVVLQCSGNHALSIRFCTITEPFHHNQAPISPHADRVFGKLVAASARWGSLFLRCSPALFPVVAQLRGKLPLLRKLTLDLCYDGPVSLDAFEIAPNLRSVDLLCDVTINDPTCLMLPWTQITQYYCEYSLWQDHVGGLERIINVRECRLLMVNQAPNEQTATLALPKLRKLYVAQGDFLDFNAPLLDELVIEPLKMTPPPDALGNLTTLLRQSGCQLTKLCLIAAIPSLADVAKLTTVLELLPSLLELCIQSRAPVESVTLDEFVLSLCNTTPRLVPRLETLTLGGYPVDSTILVDMLWNRCNANPAGTSAIRAFSLFVIIRLRPVEATQMQRLEMFRAGGLDLVIVAGLLAREAMVRVPFFHAASSNGLFWAPERL